MKKIITALLIAAVLPGLIPAVLAAVCEPATALVNVEAANTSEEPYTIKISGAQAAGNRELIVDYSGVGVGDTFEKQIRVINETGVGCEILLKRVELSGSEPLLEQLTISLIGTDGEIILNAENFEKTNLPSFFSLGENKSGSFTLRTQVGNLTNEHQGGSCAVKFFFEVVNVNADLASLPAGCKAQHLYLAALIIVLLAALAFLLSRRGKRNGG